MTKRLLAVLIFLCFCLNACGRVQKQSTEGEAVNKGIFAMNTYITISAYGGHANTVLDAEKRIEELEGLWSVTDEKSEIFQLNNNEGRAFIPIFSRHFVV